MEEDKTTKKQVKKEEDESVSQKKKGRKPSLFHFASSHKPHRWLLPSATAVSPPVSLVTSAHASISRIRKTCGEGNTANEAAYEQRKKPKTAGETSKHKRASNDMEPKKSSIKKRRQTKKNGKEEDSKQHIEQHTEAAFEAYLEQVDWDDIARALGLDGVVGK